MAKTAIEWAGHTWNPVTGCTRASAGCDNCYAFTMTKRLAAMGQEKYQGLAGKGHFNGVIKLHEDALDIPLQRKKPTVYFVNSMSDLFHKDVPFTFIDRVFDVMAQCPQHTFQVLTKRPQIAATYFYQGAPSENVWIGTSVENQEAANERIPHLLNIPAAVRFLSCEPLLGPINLHPWLCRYGDTEEPEQHFTSICEGNNQIHWAIVGGESGRDARPMHPDWARLLRDQCQIAGVAYFFKQWGHWWPTPHNTPTVNAAAAFEHGQWFVPYGKKGSGRELDGRTWDEFPQTEQSLLAG